MMALLGRVLPLGVACLVVVLSSGCASIVSGTNQSVSVVTHSASGEPFTGATCSLVNDKGSWYVTTPGSVTVHRSYGPLAVDCTKEGSEPGRLSVVSSTKVMAAGNIIFGGVVGVGVDVATGSAFDYPESIHVNMGTPKAAGSTTNAPPAESPGADARVSMASATRIVPAGSPVPMRITTNDVVGRTWIYLHPTDAARFGNVEITFAQNTVEARNRRGRSDGSYEIHDDRVCISFKEWATSTCYDVVNEDGQMKILFVKSGVKAPLTVR